MAEFLAPWFAYVSQTAALRALRATASVARATVPSASARKYAFWAAARALITMHFELRLGPPKKLPRMGAGRTLLAKLTHRSVFDLDDRWICSDVESHVRPTSPLFENRRTPTLMARAQNPLVSSRARFPTAADRTQTRGLSRYSSVISMGEFEKLSASTRLGIRSEKSENVAAMPTQSGLIALTRSALARKASASAAHCIVLAAISFPSATATRPMYSDPMVIDAVKAAAAGASASDTDVPGKATGPRPEATTAPTSAASSGTESCGWRDARLSSMDMSRSSVARAVDTESSSLPPFLSPAAAAAADRPRTWLHRESRSDVSAISLRTDRSPSRCHWIRRARELRPFPPPPPGSPPPAADRRGPSSGSSRESASRRPAREARDWTAERARWPTSSTGDLRGVGFGDDAADAAVPPFITSSVA
mmetsp:Transcript_21593/g.50789  ORF Transcript_21593/g.50789 Transcript_21593/m.50789 type:complete len:423 (-) Transcript_21593:234-1502(-)